MSILKAMLMSGVLLAPGAAFADCRQVTVTDESGFSHDMTVCDPSTSQPVGGFAGGWMQGQKFNSDEALKAQEIELRRLQVEAARQELAARQRRNEELQRKNARESESKWQPTPTDPVSQQQAYLEARRQQAIKDAAQASRQGTANPTASEQPRPTSVCRPNCRALSDKDALDCYRACDDARERHR